MFLREHFRRRGRGSLCTAATTEEGSRSGFAGESLRCLHGVWGEAKSRDDVVGQEDEVPQVFKRLRRQHRGGRSSTPTPSTTASEENGEGRAKIARRGGRRGRTGSQAEARQNQGQTEQGRGRDGRPVWLCAGGCREQNRARGRRT